MRLLNAFDERYDRMLKRLSIVLPPSDLPEEYQHRFPLAEQLLNQYDEGFKCQYCKRKMKIKDRNPLHSRSFSIDHATPLSRSGTHDINNIVFCCLACNMVKFTMTYSEFTAFLEKEQPDIDKLFMEKEASLSPEEMSFNYNKWFPPWREKNQ